MVNTGKEQLVCRNPTWDLHAAVVNYNGSHFPRAYQAQLCSQGEVCFTSSDTQAAMLSPLFTDGETEVQRSEISCPSSQSL